MSKIHTITVEFLRHGPAHNQLLSPLTDYLGICGNNGAGTVNVPYEHRDFLPKLEALRYRAQDKDGHRQEVLDKTAGEMAAILGSVPGFAGALADAAGDVLTHLELVLSASELALLPFELSKVPKGCTGGEGNSLSLQTLAPICLTRRVRSVAKGRLQWPLKPRILFVAAAPRGMRIPMEQHTQALLKAILPWMWPFTPGDAEDLNKKAGEILTILPKATMEDVEAACAKTLYTHVHVLAHGIEAPDLPGAPFGLALHSRLGEDKIDVVSGARFATALRPLRRGTQDTALPAVVTVASCDSGNVKSVVYNGASFAHELHQSGIPLVLASQFPLSFAGSIRTVETFYEQGLWGEDPRILLHRIRGRLHALHASNTHDWASLVAYAALPDDFESQLVDVQYAQAKAAIDAAMAHIDQAIDQLADAAKTNEQPLAGLQPLFARLDQATARMPIGGEYATEGKGLLASTEKRKSESLFRASCNTQDQQLRGECLRRSLSCLSKALAYYEQAVCESMTESAATVRKKRSLHWAMGQYLSLRAVLGESLLNDHWGAARVSAQFDANVADPETRAWAHGTLAELHLLLLAYAGKGLPLSQQKARSMALEHTEQLLNLVGRDAFPVYSTRRQFQRYVDWWGSEAFQAELAESGSQRSVDWLREGGLIPMAKQVVELLSGS